MRGGFSRYIGPGLGEPRRALWISEQLYSLSHRSFILIFSLYLVFSTIFSVFILPVVLLNLRPSILRDIATCPGAAKQSCSALQNFSWRPWNVATYKLFHILSEYDILCWFPMIPSGLWRCICVCIAIHHVSENSLCNTASKR